MQYFPFLLRFKRSLSPLFLWFSDMAHAKTTKKWAVWVFMISLSKFLLLFVCFGAYPLASWRDVRRGDWNIEQFSHSWTKQQQRSHAQETSLSLFSPWSVCENAGKTSLLNIISLFFFWSSHTRLKMELRPLASVAAVQSSRTGQIWVYPTNKFVATAEKLQMCLMHFFLFLLVGERSWLSIWGGKKKLRPTSSKGVQAIIKKTKKTVKSKKKKKHAWKHEKKSAVGEIKKKKKTIIDLRFRKKKEEEKKRTLQK